MPGTARIDDLAENQATLAALCRRFHVRRLDLFGSALDESFDPTTSDIDLLVAFDPLPPGSYADSYFGLREALAALFDRPVDLVTEEALANPYLRRAIECRKRTLFTDRAT